LNNPSFLKLPIKTGGNLHRNRIKSRNCKKLYVDVDLYNGTTKNFLGNLQRTVSVFEFIDDVKLYPANAVIPGLAFEVPLLPTLIILLLELMG
jgi:hypothetical protein